MKTLTWIEIDKDWNGLQKQHRMEIAQAVSRYCIGHKMSEVAEHLGYTKTWVCKQLDFAGIGGVTGNAPLTGKPKDANSVLTATNRVLSEFAPEIQVHVADDGKGNQEIASVTGDDAEAFQPYLDHYTKKEGYEPAAAIRLAKAEWAAEEAVNAGVIQESTNKKNEKVNRILFPGDAKSTFDLDLKMHMARVEAAARFLDTAKVPYLRRLATCERVAAANEKWVEQFARVLNLHPTLKKG